MAHTLTPHLGERDLDTALFTNHTAVLKSLVLTAETLIVFYGAENLGAEQAVALGLERAIVDGLWFLYFTIGP